MRLVILLKKKLVDTVLTSVVSHFFFKLVECVASIKKHDNLCKSKLLPETFGISYLVKARHQILHRVTSLSTLGRHGGHRQRGLEVWVAFALTLRTAQVSSEETEVVQRKNLHMHTQSTEA